MPHLLTANTLTGWLDQRRFPCRLVACRNKFPATVYTDSLAGEEPNMRDVELVEECNEFANEVLYLGPVPKGGRFVLAPDRDNTMSLFWIFDTKARRRPRTRVPVLSAQIKAMIQAGLEM